MRTGLDRLATRVWARRGATGVAIWLSLLPLAAISSLAARTRNTLYRTGIRRSRRAGVPVVSVGNLTVGGTGKTPVVLWLAGEFERQGRRVAILSRGYRRRSRGVHVVAERGRLLLDPERAGDEPAMLGRCITGLVLVGERRAAAAARAVAEGAELLLLDDGFQHRALARDFDLMLVDAWRPLANGWTLPAGPLREPARGAKRADAVLVVERLRGHDGANDAAPDLPRVLRQRPCYRARLLPRSLVLPDGEAWVERPLATLAGQRVLAVSGVADAESFYHMLRLWEARITGVIEYPDHHRYGREDWRAIRDAARAAEFIVTTEKDLVKLEQFPFARGALAALRVGVEVEAAGDLLERMTAAIDREPQR